MFTISFNVLYKTSDRKVILTESPYLFSNEEITPIISQIRKVIDENFSDLAKQLGITKDMMALGDRKSVV